MKKIRRYFFEFTIVFLAVFLGFLADNFRENLSDREREKQYASALVKDLINDSLQLKKLIETNENKSTNLDSLSEHLRTDLSKKTNLERLYNLMVHGRIFSFDMFRSNETTIVQLKSTAT